MAKFDRALDTLAIVVRDCVAILQTSFCRRAIGADFGNQNAVDAGKLQFPRLF
jgi:hypothetical protein